MYLSSKSSKVVLKQNALRLPRAVSFLSQPQLLLPSQKGFFVAHSKMQESSVAFSIQQSRRFFSLPAYEKLEMPNLSPTMEKVLIAC
jgi:hypothetical protein